MKQIFTIIFVYTLFCAQAQVTSGDLTSYLNEWLSDIPGASGNDYVLPSFTQEEDWSDAVNKILNQNILAARSIVEGFNYQITEFTHNDSGQIYYILEEKTPRVNHWGLYVFNAAPCRNLVIQAPHPKKDINTGKEAIFCFGKLHAKSLFISGTNRCNHSDFSSCSGTTSVCATTSTSYRISDMAHHVNSMFQTTTKAILTDDANSVFIQFHGFTKKETDPYVILSNGTRAMPSIDYVSQLKNELAAIDTSLSFKVAHIDLDWKRLIGFTNTQGRMINLSPDPCETKATNTTGHFIHFEQEKTKLRQDSMGWSKVAMALGAVFSCSPLEIQESAVKDVCYVYPNPNGIKVLTIELEKGIDRIWLVDLLGKMVLFEQYDALDKIKVNLDGVELGFYILMIQSQNQQFYKRVIVE